MQTAEETIEIIKSIIQDTEPTQEEGRKLTEEIAKLEKEQEEHISSKNFKKAEKLDKEIDEKILKFIPIVTELANCRKLIKKALNKTSSSTAN